MAEDEVTVERLTLAAEQRWAQYARELVGAGALLDAEGFAKKLGSDIRALDEALASRMVFFVECAGVRLFPAFYADALYKRRQLQAVTQALGVLPGGSKWQFFTCPKGSLGGRTPLEALTRGDFRQVTMTAEAFALG